VAVARAASPDVAAMNLQAGDVPGAKVASQRKATLKGYTAAHIRTFVFSAPNSGPHLILLNSETALAATPATATADVAGAEKPFRSQASRNAIIVALAKDAKVKPKAVALGRPHKVTGYDQGFEIAVSVAANGRRLYENLVFVRLDRVFVQMLEIGTRPIPDAVTTKYATAIAQHIGTELTPVDVTVPTISGTVQQGQSLTATPGTWIGNGATFAYQWQHCDAAGANCTDIAGATAQTYGVTAADVGTTLHVVVSATNRFGTASAPSVPTAVVS
jgi:hypothetical protein